MFTPNTAFTNVTDYFAVIYNPAGAVNSRLLQAAIRN